MDFWNRLTHWLGASPTNVERPPIDALGAYNIPPTEGHEVWTTGKVRRWTATEFYRVREAVVAALSKHGKVYGEPGIDHKEHDFFVYDDKCFDRTQTIELETTERLEQILAPAVAELQRVLAGFPLWRAMFLGHGQDDHAREQFFVVYPDVVRIRQLTSGKSVGQAVSENAQLRLQHLQVREAHRSRRRADLKKAIAAAFTVLNGSDAEVEMAAWFRTVSWLDSDWGGEGRAGTAVWLVLRNDLSDPYKAVQSETSFYLKWASPDDGEVFDKQPVRTDARQLLYFEDYHEEKDDLVVTISGKLYRFGRPSDSQM
jgi:hypothetical protein